MRADQRVHHWTVTHALRQRVAGTHMRRCERKGGSGARHRRRMLTADTTRRDHHILVVEPDPLFRLLLCVALAGEFSDFHAVATFNEARALLTEHSFAAIIAENDLKGGSGLALYEFVRKQHPSLPFVLMCGGIHVCRDDANFRFFAKPFLLKKFAATFLAMVAPTAGSR